MEVSYERAKLTVMCGLHKCPVEYYVDSNAQHILDKANLGCPKLWENVGELHRQQATLRGAASAKSIDDWKRDHPEEANLYPADYVPYMDTKYWPPEYKQAMDELYRQEEELADRDFQSWTVILEEEVKDEAAGAGGTAECDRQDHEAASGHEG